MKKIFCCIQINHQLPEVSLGEPSATHVGDVITTTESSVAKADDDDKSAFFKDL